MSTPTTTTDGGQGTSSPTPSSTQSDSDTATLYLFTFLATILILVLLSASLVLRSYILRRRYRRRFQQALTDTLFVDFDRSTLNGGQFDPLGLRRPTRRLGPKPVMRDIWIHPVNDDAWSSFTPVAVRCTSLSPPTLKVCQPSAVPPPTLSPSLFSPLRLFSWSQPGHTPTPSPPAAPVSPSPCIQKEKDAARLSVCMLITMPDASAPVHRLMDAKGKGVDPLESQAPLVGGDANPLSRHRSGARLPNAGEEDGLPLLEFGVVDVHTDGM